MGAHKRCMIDITIGDSCKGRPIASMPNKEALTSEVHALMAMALPQQIFQIYHSKGSRQKKKRAPDPKLYKALQISVSLGFGGALEQGFEERKGRGGAPQGISRLLPSCRPIWDESLVETGRFSWKPLQSGRYAA